jgi:uncharacterized protein (DUF427 family)
MWRYTGKDRPPFAELPGEGQESVWDYPRPPALVRSDRDVVVIAGSDELARSSRCYRVLETASPPTWYVPAQDVNGGLLVPAPGSSMCEWKGRARYWALASDPDGEPVAWSYPQPTAAFAPIADAFGFYPGRVACYVGQERVRPQPGYFYGGWLTDEISGPVKGEPGTGHW